MLLLSAPLLLAWPPSFIHPQLPAACVLNRPILCMEGQALTSSLLWPLAGVHVLSVAQSQRDTGFPGRCWSLTAITLKCSLTSSRESTGAQSHSHGKRALLALSLPDSWNPLGLKEKAAFGSVSPQDGGGRSGLSCEVQKAPEFHSPCPPPCSSSLPALCFPSMKIVNLFYLFQSILGSVPLRAEAAMVTLPTHALKIHRV